MPRVQWPLWRNRPCVEIILTLKGRRRPYRRILLADTGAGMRYSSFELILEETDCLRCGGRAGIWTTLSGAYNGTFRVYDIDVQLPALSFSQCLQAVGVPSMSARFDGIACFRFLNRFTYGNFGDPGQFGLEC